MRAGEIVSSFCCVWENLIPMGINVTGIGWVRTHISR